MGTEQSGETRDKTRETSRKGHKVNGDSTSASAGETSRQRWEHTREKRGNTHDEIDTKETVLKRRPLKYILNPY
jgi:hypothetical protein